MNTDPTTTPLDYADEDPRQDAGSEPAPAVNDSEPTPQPASQDEVAPADPAPPADPPKADPPAEPKSARAALIDKLTGVEDPPEAADDPETPPEPPKAEDPPKADGTPPKAAAPPADEEEKPLTNETAAKMRPGEVRRKINKLIEQRNSLRAPADLGREIIETCEANNFTPADYKEWVAIGIGLQRSDPRAIEAYKQIAAKAGIQTEVAPAPAPALTPELDAWLTEQIKVAEVSDTAAAEIRRRLGARPAAAPAQAAPAAAPPPPPRSPAQPDPMAKGAADIDRIAAEYEKKLGADRFKQLEPLIQARLAQSKGAHPSAWGPIFRAAVETELAKIPKPATVQPGLRTSSTAPTKPVFKSERERVIHEFTA